MITLLRLLAALLRALTARARAADAAAARARDAAEFVVLVHRAHVAGVLHVPPPSPPN